MTDDRDFQRYLLPPEPEKYGFWRYMNDSAETMWTALGVIAFIAAVSFVVWLAFSEAAGNREKVTHRVDQERLRQQEEHEAEQRLLESCIKTGGTYVDTPGVGGTCVVNGKVLPAPK